jgi:energy-coupling factor transporter ATP-binding protein EcfA2
VRPLSHRFERRVTTNLKLSGIPAPKTLEKFDFEAQPSVPTDVIEELATLRFLQQGENVVFLGPCGVGKSHLAVALALKAIERGHRAYFLSPHELVTRSRVAREKNRLDVLLRVITRADLFLLDEVGYLPLESEDATFLFEAVEKIAMRRSDLRTIEVTCRVLHSVNGLEAQEYGGRTMSKTIPNVTIGVDLGDRFSYQHVLDADGECLEEGRIRTTHEALRQRFENVERARVVWRRGRTRPG